MMDAVFGDLRQIVLGLLFVVAFGWMAALMFPGAPTGEDAGWQQMAQAGGDVYPPRP